MDMHQAVEKKYQRLRSFFFGLCILASGLLLLTTSKNIIKTLAAENWRAHSGTLESTARAGGFYFGTSLLRYSYEVDGRKYQGTRIGYGISSTAEIQSAERSVRVLVNPDDHEDAVLVAGFKKTHFTGLLLSCGFLWLALYLWRKTK
jgi:hypothetical protein